MCNNKIMEGSSADILMNQYKSVYTVPRQEFIKSDWNSFFTQYCNDCINERTHICLEDQTSNYFLSDLFVDVSDVVTAINKITPSESAGPDGIPGIMLRKCADSVAFPISILWNE